MRTRTMHAGTRVLVPTLTALVLALFVFAADDVYKEERQTPPLPCSEETSAITIPMRRLQGADKDFFHRQAAAEKSTTHQLPGRSAVASVHSGQLRDAEGRDTQQGFSVVVQGAHASSAEPVRFQCTKNNGETVWHLFRKILRRSSKGLYLDVGTVDEGKRQMLFVRYCPPPTEKTSVRQINALKIAVLADFNHEESIFPASIPREVLLEQYGLLIPTYCCSLPHRPEALSLEDGQEASSLLNLFVAMPRAEGNICLLDIKKIDPSTVVYYFVEMVRRVANLHIFNILHRKISCSSFVLIFTRNKALPQIYLQDFTSAQVFTGVEQPYTRVAHLSNLDPDLAATTFSPLKLTRRLIFTKQQDAWAMGFVLYKMICNGSSDPFGIFRSPASELVILFRIMRLATSAKPIGFDGCLPEQAHPLVPQLRNMVTRFLDKQANTRLLPEIALQEYPELFNS